MSASSALGATSVWGACASVRRGSVSLQRSSRASSGRSGPVRGQPVIITRRATSAHGTGASPGPQAADDDEDLAAATSGTLGTSTLEEWNERGWVILGGEERVVAVLGEASEQTDHLHGQGGGGGRLTSFGRQGGYKTSSYITAPMILTASSIPILYMTAVAEWAGEGGLAALFGLAAGSLFPALAALVVSVVLSDFMLIWVARSYLHACEDEGDPEANLKLKHQRDRVRPHSYMLWRAFEAVSSRRSGQYT